MANQFPIGAVISFGGNNVPALEPEWMLCDGRTLPINETYHALFEAIGTVNGGNGSTEFHLPDYRGRFLRGVDHGTGRDPDAATREAAAEGGSTGDRVGSIQDFATAHPEKGFSTFLPHLPTVDHQLAATAIGHDIASWNDGTWEGDITFKNGDKESRPANLYLFYCIYTGITR